MQEVLDIAAGHALWRERAATTVARTDGRRYGVGFAMALQSFGTSGDAVLAEVGVDEAGAIFVRSNAVDMGNGSATTLGVVVADALGSNAAIIGLGDTSLWPALGLTTAKDTGLWADPNYVRKATSASSSCLTAFHQVHAARSAARVLYETGVLAAAAQLWNRPVGGLADSARWQDGALAVPGLAPLPMRDLARAMHASGTVTRALVHAYYQDEWVEATYRVDGVARRWPLTAVVLGRGELGRAAKREKVLREQIRPPSIASSSFARTTFAPSANLVAVSIGPVGDVRVEQLVSIVNAGPLITPALVEGQSHGALSMALGYTLHEASLLGPEGPGNGRWNLHRYAVPLARDLPWRAHELICLKAGLNEPSRGIGEALLCAIPAATLNALAAATGHRFTALPVTRDEIRKVLNA